MQLHAFVSRYAPNRFHEAWVFAICLTHENQNKLITLIACQFRGLVPSWKWSQTWHGDWRAENWYRHVIRVYLKRTKDVRLYERPNHTNNFICVHIKYTTTPNMHHCAILKGRFYFFIFFVLIAIRYFFKFYINSGSICVYTTRSA